jgi:hypothetical protein
LDSEANFNLRENEISKAALSYFYYVKAVIEISSGKGLDLLSPDPDVIDLEDIALGLSRQSRFC